jgi:hypothetical protein
MGSLGHRVATSKGGYHTSVDAFSSLNGLGGGHVDKALEATAAAMLFDLKKNEPEPIVPDHVVEGLAELLKIDTADAWREEKLGPLTERYFSLRTKDELLALGKELDQFLEPSKPKSVMVKLLTSKRPCKMPKELAAGKAKKGK